MPDVYCFSYVEDEPSAAVIRKLVETRNGRSKNNLIFHNGFPSITRGYRGIKNRCEAFLNMARVGIYTLVLTDLDTAECPCNLIRDWFYIPKNEVIDLPQQCIFRVAVREVESWILADHTEWANYIGIPESNFSDQPDQLNDPKEHILNVIRRKGKKKIHREMLPSETTPIGPRYNEVLCNFIENRWSPDRAAQRSPSLDRALKAILQIIQ